MKDHLSWETTKFGGRFIQVSLYHWLYGDTRPQGVKWGCRSFSTLWCGVQNILEAQCHQHACWCSGSRNHWFICRHAWVLTIWENFCFQFNSVILAQSRHVSSKQKIYNKSELLYNITHSHAERNQNRNNGINKPTEWRLLNKFNRSKWRPAYVHHYFTRKGAGLCINIW